MNYHHLEIDFQMDHLNVHNQLLLIDIGKHDRKGEHKCQHKMDDEMLIDRCKRNLDCGHSAGASATWAVWFRRRC